MSQKIHIAKLRQMNWTPLKCPAQLKKLARYFAKKDVMPWDEFLYQLWQADLTLNGKNAGNFYLRNSDCCIFKGWKSISKLCILFLPYDATPPCFV
jgi:hypothetical protein